MMSLIFACTGRKRAPVPAELQLRAVAGGDLRERATRWWQRLEESEAPRLPASQLYVGEHWGQARQALAAVVSRGQRARLWVASAGYGLVSASAELRPYSATFTSGSPDCVLSGPGSRSERSQMWWATLAGFEGPERGEVRSLRELAAADPGAPMVLVAAPPYVLALRGDALAARAVLRDPGSLIVVSNHVLLADRGLAPSLIAVDARWRSIAGGTMLGLNARVARWLLARDNDASLTAPRLRATCEEMARGAEKAVRFDRRPVGDTHVLEFLRAALGRDPSAGWTSLLRCLRGRGDACEQGRFRGLHRQVRGEVAGRA